MKTTRTGTQPAQAGLKHPRILLVLTVLVFALILAGCGGSSDSKEPQEAAPPTQEPTPTATATVSPLPTPGEQPLQVSPLPTEAAESTSGSRGVKPVNVSDPEQRIVERAIERLAQLLDIDPSEIKVVSVEAVEWRSSALGCPQPGRMYAQVITPGYKIVLEAQGEEYEFHTDSRPEGSMVLCQK